MRYFFVVLFFVGFLYSHNLESNAQSFKQDSMESKNIESTQKKLDVSLNAQHDRENTTRNLDSKTPKDSIESRTTKLDVSPLAQHDDKNIESKTPKDSNQNIESKKIESITATGSASLDSEVASIPGHIDIVTQKEINKSTNAKITDVVKKLSGVRIANDVAFNPRPNIKIRGINYGTLVMLDGVILSDLEGESRILNQISLFDVEKVEVARGAFSSLYGSNAIGGVINFITSMPKSFTIESIAGYGSEILQDTADKNLAKFYFSIGNAFFTNKALRIKFSAGLTTTQGYASFPTYVATKPANTSGGFYDKAGRFIIGDGGRREYRIWDTRLKLEYDVGENGLLSSMFSLSSHSYEMANPKSYLLDSNGSPTFTLPNSSQYPGTSPFVGSGFGGLGYYTHFLGNISYLHYFENSELKISLSSVNLFSRWGDALAYYDNPNPPPTLAGGIGETQDIYTSSNYFDILHHYHINENHNLATSLQFRYLNFDSLYYALSNWRDLDSIAARAGRGAGGMSFVASVFMDWEALWLDNLSTNLGLRYDFWLNFNSYAFGSFESGALDSNNSSHISPKFSINYTPFSWWKLKFSIGSGFRMPTIRERFQPGHGGEMWQPTPFLKAENALSFEVGSEINTRFADIVVYYFHTEMSDMIYRQGGGSVANPYFYANAGRGRINGVEFSLSVPIWRSLRLDSNYTLTLARVIENAANPASVGKQLVNTPEHIANISLSYGESVGIYGSLWAFFTSAFYNDDINSPPLYRTFRNYDAAFSLNAKLGYIFSNGLDLSASFNNITNNRYYDSYIVPGASFYLQTRYKFRKS
ncbi:TonB-dependent receptor [Helicobacter saguini]|uniref:TonB-dependent receptor n=1 Tax=Helicobacter saguini TaxID=1548018 RepID=A0A4V6I1Y3_9HELI|nr:TonB-dependent receptor [Helicobacter saguini]MWV66629.1 TonB-dependent receptor [Helicobacter saguini]TLD94112.1 TonB-dependent receptor [Helicobacter saguini]